MLWGIVGNARYNRNDASTGTEHVPRPSQRISADCVDDEVDVAKFLIEPAGAVVEDLIGSQVFDESDT